MIKIKIEEKEYELPENWTEVSFSNYKKFRDFEVDGEDYVGYILLIISVMTGIKTEVLYSLNKDSAKELINSMLFLLEFEEDKKVINKFEIKGIQYKLKDLSKLTLGEYISIEELIKKGSIQNAGNIIYVMFSDGEKFDASKIMENGKLIEDTLSVKEVLNLLDFFLYIGQIYTKTLNYSSNLKIMKEKMKEKNLLIRKLKLVLNGIGFHWSKGWRKVI